MKSCYLCQRCLPDWLAAIQAHRKNRWIKKGQPVFSEGEAVNGIFFVYSGRFKVYKKWDAEKDLIIRFAQKGDILGHLGLGKSTVYPVTATALENSLVCYIELDFFKSTLLVNAQLTYQLLLFFAEELQQSERRMRDLVHMSVKGRIAQALLLLKEQFGINAEGYIDIELSRQDLASFAGAVYETLFRVMNELIRKNFIEVKGKYIKLTDDENLKTLTHQIQEL